jgi:hypothetical protein
MFEIEENNRLRSKVKILEDFNKNKIDWDKWENFVKKNNKKNS